MQQQQQPSNDDMILQALVNMPTALFPDIQRDTHYDVLLISLLIAAHHPAFAGRMLEALTDSIPSEYVDFYRKSLQAFIIGVNEVEHGTHPNDAINQVMEVFNNE